MQYRVAGSMTPEQFKADIKLKQSQGKKVMISLGGGGQHFTLDTQEGKQRFIKSVVDICAEFGFDGIDIDFETSSMNLDPGDTDTKHPTTPSTVNLISAMRDIHDHFGPNFMLSLVPEGSQTPAGYPGYGGQFGSYIPLLEGIRDMLAFADTQDYNCPPIQGLDGEYYMPGSVDYHAAATELFLHGFDVGRDPKHHFDPLPPEKVIIGYLNSDTTPQIVAESMRMLMTGKSNLPTRYKMRRPAGYPPSPERCSGRSMRTAARRIATRTWSDRNCMAFRRNNGSAVTRSDLEGSPGQHGRHTPQLTPGSLL